MKDTDTFTKVILFAAIGSLFCGFSLAVIVATLGQPTWYSSLHMVADPTAPGYAHTTTIIGAVNGVFFGAGFFGTFLSGWLNDRVGRVNSIRIGSTIGIIGGIIQTAAVNQAMVSCSAPYWSIRPTCKARRVFHNRDTETV